MSKGGPCTPDPRRWSPDLPRSLMRSLDMHGVIIMGDRQAMLSNLSLFHRPLLLFHRSISRAVHRDGATTGLL